MATDPQQPVAATPEVNYMRQVQLFDPELFHDTEITIAGLGNIGSHAACALARMGLRKFVIWDFDKVEEHNLSSQAYKVEDVGKYKTDAVVDAMLALNPRAAIEKHTEAFTGQMEGGLLVSAVDSMEARRVMAEAIKDKPVYVVDGRMGGGQIEVWSQPAAEWPKTLEHEAGGDPCGARFISYTSYIMAGFIANNVKRHLNGQKLVPMVMFHADTMEIIRKDMV